MTRVVPTGHRGDPPCAAAGHEYETFTVLIRHDKTVGTAAGGGCEVPLYVVLNSINLETTKPGNTTSRSDRRTGATPTS
jgi:hypothetical protein